MQKKSLLENYKAVLYLIIVFTFIGLVSAMLVKNDWARMIIISVSLLFMNWGFRWYARYLKKRDTNK